MWELVDVWTDVLDKNEYISFLDTLRDKLKLPPAKSNKLKKY